MNQKLAIKEIRGVREPEPAIFEISVMLEDNSLAVLRMNVFALQKLSAAIQPFAGSS
jgi:hypothetical protein